MGFLMDPWTGLSWVSPFICFLFLLFCSFLVESALFCVDVKFLNDDSLEQSSLCERRFALMSSLDAPLCDHRSHCPKVCYFVEFVCVVVLFKGFPIDS